MINLFHKRNFCYFYILYFIRCLLQFLPLPAQEVPRTINFTKSDYEAQNQNWDVAQSDDYTLYLANSEGLVQFDGTRWQTLRLPEKQIIRAVAVDAENRIFTGAYGEFGYWEKKPFSALQYHSLSSGLKYEQVGREEIWNIIPQKGYVLFQSFSTIYKYNYDTIQLISPPGNIMFIHEVNGQLLVQVLEKGIYQLYNDGTFELLPGSEIFKDKRVTTILPFQHDGFLVGTNRHGLFQYVNGKFSVWPTDAAESLIIHQINKGLHLSNGNYVFGTILNGVYVLSAEGKLLYGINQTNGLQNNTVLSLLEDRRHNLWVGLDRGIDLIELNSPLTFFQDKSGKLGAVYTAAVYNGRLYVGTNQGVFARRWPENFSKSNDFTLLEGTQGQVWQLKVMDGQLLCGHNDGTFRISPTDEVTKISSITGGWSLIQHPFQDSLLVQATYTGLAIFKKDKFGMWQFNRKIDGFTEPVKKILFDKTGAIWAINPYRGLYRLELDDHLTKVIHQKTFTKADGLASEFRLDIAKVLNRLLVYSDTLTLEVDPARQHLRPVEELEGYDLHRAKVLAGNSGEWFRILPQQVSWIKDERIDSIPIALIPNYENIVSLGDGKYLFCLDDGYAIYKSGLQQSTLVHTPLSPVITEIVVLNKKNELVPLLLQSEKPLRIPDQNYQLHIYYTVPEFTNVPQFQYKLDGIMENWSAWDAKAVKEFVNLPPGNYTFNVRSSLEKTIAALPFVVEPKWYQSSWMKLIYILTVIGLIFLSVRYHNYRLRRQQRILELEKERQLHQQRIQSANDKLRNDVRTKSKELASTTMNLLQKNEILNRIKEELNNIKSDLGIRLPDKHYNRLLHLIDTHISSEYDWQVFEANFNELHDEFFRRLKSDFPELTPGDLKLAAYLKMNLSSKEIAPLLNISLRSVENKRYRLRQKMKLTEEHNLTDFMIRY